MNFSRQSKIGRVLRHSVNLAVAGALCSHCATKRDQQDLQNKMLDMQARLLKIEGDLGSKEKEREISQKIANQNMSTEKTNNEIARIKGEIDRIKVGVVTGKLPGEPEVVDGISARLAAVEARLTVLEQEKAEKAEKANEKEASKKKNDHDSINLETYKKHFATKQFKKITESAPSAIKSLRGNDKLELSYYYAESLYKLGDMKNSALAYDAYISLSPKPEKMPFALMRLGDCFRNLGDKNTAAIYYKDLIARYPKSQEATTAKGRLTEE